MEESFDARAIKAVGGIDARAVGAVPEIPACPECGTVLRASGAGRRPVYCSRSCSSKAYRRRRAENHHRAVAEALIASRAETPDSTDDSDSTDAAARHLLDLAAGIRHAAARYLENLQHARPGGPGEHGDHALDLFERSVTSATHHLLRTARLLHSHRHTDRPGPGQGTGPAGSGQAAAAHSPRVGSGPAGDTTRTPPGPVPPRVETPPRTPPRRRPLHHGPTPATGPLHPGPDTAAPGTTTDDGTAVAGTSTGGGTPLRLALAAERTSPSPSGRGLGAPTGTWSAENGTLLVDGWDNDPTVFQVRRPHGPAGGWVASVGDHWGSYIDGRLVIDAADGEPWLSQDARYAVSLLRMAFDQDLA